MILVDKRSVRLRFPREVSLVAGGECESAKGGDDAGCEHGGVVS